MAQAEMTLNKHRIKAVPLPNPALHYARLIFMELDFLF
jgi:hypothetical protein